MQVKGHPSEGHTDYRTSISQHFLEKSEPPGWVVQQRKIKWTDRAKWRRHGEQVEIWFFFTKPPSCFGHYCVYLLVLKCPECCLLSSDSHWIMTRHCISSLSLSFFLFCGQNLIIFPAEMLKHSMSTVGGLNSVSLSHTPHGHDSRCYGETSCCACVYKQGKGGEKKSWHQV